MYPALCQSVRHATGKDKWTHLKAGEWSRMLPLLKDKLWTSSLCNCVTAQLTVPKMTRNLLQLYVARWITIFLCHIIETQKYLQIVLKVQFAWCMCMKPAKLLV